MIGFQENYYHRLDALVLEFQIRFKTQVFEVPSTAWDSLAMDKRTKKNIDTLSIDDLYNNLSVFEQDIQKTSFSSQMKDIMKSHITADSNSKYKGDPLLLVDDYTPMAQDDKDESLYVYGKTWRPQPQSPSPTVSNASSIVFSSCHQMTVMGAWSFEQVSISTQKTQSQVPTPPQTVDPSCAQHVKTPRQPIRTPVTPSPIPSYNRQNWNQRMERELGAGYSFERKPCFVCGSLSHLIKDCDYYEKKMAREAALKSKRVIHVDARQARPAWTNTNRVNKANQFTPRPVQLSNIRPNFSTASRTIKTGRVNVNTGKQNVRFA
ncbi:hypothetical protein Tco_1142880 [Tanacetum coccineum]